MENKSIALVLGGTYPHKTLLKRLKERGYYTILIDYYENPVAKADADEHICESTLDMDVVLEIARKCEAKLVIGTSVDKTNVTATFVGEKLGLPIPYSYNTAKNISNKATMKNIMLKAGIPTSKYIVIKEGEEYNLDELCFPLVVKPTDGNSSKGVYKVNNINELKRGLLSTFKVTKSKEVVVEEYVSGAEVSINSFIADKKAHVLYTMQRILPENNGDTVLHGTLSIAPANISAAATAILKETIENIAMVFELDNTPLLLQAIIDGDNVNVIEFAPRTGGGDSSTKIWYLNKFDIINATIDSYLGIKVKPHYAIPDFMFTSYYIYTEPGIFNKIVNYKNLIDDETLVFLYATKTSGMVISSGRESTNRVAYFCVTGYTREELIIKIHKVLKTIKVIDINGHELKIDDNSELLNQ